MKLPYLCISIKTTNKVKIPMNNHQINFNNQVPIFHIIHTSINLISKLATLIPPISNILRNKMTKFNINRFRKM